MQHDTGRLLPLIVVVISFAVIIGMLSPYLCEASVSTSRPFEDIEIEVEFEEAVVARNRATKKRVVQRFVAQSKKQIFMGRRSIPPVFFSGHRFDNGLIAPLII